MKINPSLMIKPPLHPALAKKAKKTRVKHGSSLGSARVFLDKAALDRIIVIQGYVAAETGHDLSVSMIIRLALHQTATRVTEATDTASLLARVNAAKEGF